MIDFGNWVDEEYGVPAEEAQPSLDEIEQSTAAQAGKAQG